MGERILKLEASAGSGKTYRLVQAFLQRLFLTFASLPQRGAGVPEEAERLLPTVLAVTFTIKAANEMKGRILERLQQLALLHDAPPLPPPAAAAAALDELHAATGLPPARLALLAGRILETMLAAYEDFNVRTIDSLMSAMVKVLSPDLGLPPDFEIDVEMGAAVWRAAREYIAAEADRDWPAVAAYLGELRAARGLSGWTPDEELARQLERLFALGLRQELQARPAADELRRRGGERLESFRARLAVLLAVIGREPNRDGRCLHLRGQAVNAALRAAVTGFLAAPSAAHLDGLVDRAFFAKEQAEELTQADAPPGYVAEFAAAYGEMRRALADLLLNRSQERVAGFRDFLAGFRDHWRRQPHPFFVGEFARELEGKLREWPDGVYPYLYLKLSDRLRHFLFDEFQDTSELQFKALAPLIDEVLASDPAASLFIVGDRKQAIYRWRGGNADMMEEPVLRRLVPALDHVAPRPFGQRLETNYRSGGRIVEFNNGFWAPAAISGVSDDPRLQEAIRRNFAGSEQRAGGEAGAGQVEIRRLPAAAVEDTAEPQDPLLAQVAATVAEAGARGWELQDMAVLCRFNEDVRRTMAHLSGAGIACVSEQSLTLASHPVVNELLALLRFLDFPADNLSFYAFVRGQLFARAAARFPEELAAFGDDVVAAAGPFLYKRFQELCPGLWRELLAPHFRAVGFLPVYDLVSDISRTFRLFGEFPDCAPYLLTLLDMLHEQERAGAHSIAAFLQAWREDLARPQPRMVELPQTTAAVRVMTIHQAKGLQFPLVILPLNDRRERHDLEPVAHDGRLFLVDKIGARLCPELAEMASAEEERELIDRLNLLYVAFTRPQLALTVLLQEPSRPTAAGLASLLLRHPLLAGRREWPAAWGDLPPRPVAPPPAAGTPPKLADKRIATREWQREFLVFQARPGDGGEAAARGERLHRVLSELQPAADREELLGQLRERASAHSLDAPESARLERFLGDERVWPLFCGDAPAWAEKELAVPGPHGWQVQRLDRLRLEPDRVTLLEFKSGSRDPGHRLQVGRYTAALRALFPGRACRALLLYIDEPAVEEVPC